MKKKNEEKSSQKRADFNDVLNKHKIAFLVVAIIVVISATAASYAYFAATVRNAGTVYNNVVETGKMSLLFTDNPIVQSTTNMLPGQSFQKTFKVKNNGTVDTTYTLYLIDVVNTFNPTSDFVYTIAPKSGSTGYSTQSAQTVPASNDALITNYPISPNEEHEYVITFTFTETGSSQDTNKGATFSAKLALNDPGAPQVASEIEYFNENSETCGNDHSVECAIDEIATKLGVDFSQVQGS